MSTASQLLRSCPEIPPVHLPEGHNQVPHTSSVHNVGLPAFEAEDIELFPDVWIAKFKSSIDSISQNFPEYNSCVVNCTLIQTEADVKSFIDATVIHPTLPIVHYIAEVCGRSGQRSFCLKNEFQKNGSCPAEVLAMIRLRRAVVLSSPFVFIEFKGPYSVTDYMTKLLDRKESGELQLDDNDNGWNEICRQLSKYSSSAGSIIIAMDQESWCLFEIGSPVFGPPARYLHGPVSGISKGQYGLTAREAVAFAVWRQFYKSETVPPDDQWPALQVEIYKPTNILSKDLPVFNGSTRRFTPRRSHRPGFRSGSGQGTDLLVRQTDGLPSSLDHEGSEPKRMRLKFDSTIEIEVIEELKENVWLCRRKESTDILIVKRMKKESREFESYLSLADFQGGIVPHCYGKWTLTSNDGAAQSGEENGQEETYLLFEFVEGLSFSEIGNISLQTRLSLWRDLSGFIHILEARAMIHGDVKPDNLILYISPDLTCGGVLIDFDYTVTHVSKNEREASLFRYYTNRDLGNLRDALDLYDGDLEV